MAQGGARRKRRYNAGMLSRKPFEAPAALLRRAAELPPLAMAVVNAVSATALQSARMALEHELITPLLVGEAALMRRLAGEINWPLDNIQLVHADGEADAVRKTVDLVRGGAARGIMKGHVHTDVFMSGLVRKESGLRGGGWFTHVFHLTVPGSERTLLLTDAAVNIAPDVTVRFAAMQNAVELALKLGVARPKVAVLSATEEVNPRMPSSTEAAQLAELAAQKIPQAQVCGPLAFDGIVSPEAARAKNITHPVAGHADIIVVPGIETGNALYKMMVYFMSACAAGVVLGAKAPIVLTSRADPPAARLASAALAAVAAAD